VPFPPAALELTESPPDAPLPPMPVVFEPVPLMPEFIAVLLPAFEPVPPALESVPEFSALLPAAMPVEPPVPPELALPPEPAIWFAVAPALPFGI
jgi:hypothetical protein